MAERKVVKRGKTKLEINKKEFQDIINQLEAENTFSAIGDLWKAVEETDWAKNQKVRPLTAGVARIRAEEHNIKYKTSSDSTGKRGKTKLEINKKEFQDVINTLEANTTFSKLDDLWKAVEETDWAKNQKVRPLTAGVARVRAIELGLSFNTCSTGTGKRGRTKLEVDKDEFQKIVNELESNNDFDKVDDLWKAVEETDWAKNQKVRPLTAIVAKIRAEELGIEYETTSSASIGKRGRTKLEVDKDEFQNIVNELESKNNFEKVLDLWKAVEETDWAKNQKVRPLTAIVAKIRAEELGIEYETANGSSGKRGRAKLEVDKDEFQKIVNELETKYHFDKIDDLWKAVENTNWAKDQDLRPLTAIVAKMRAEELGIQTKIQPRKRRSNEDHTEANDLEARTNKSYTINDTMYQENAGIPRMGNMTLVLIPAGSCPYKLEGVEENVVVVWCQKVIGYFSKLKQQITPTALTYFARQYFDVNSNDFVSIREHIQMNKHQIYETIVSE